MARNDGFGLVKWLVIVAVVAASAGGWWWWRHPGEQRPDYKTVPVTSGDLIQAVTATGQLNPVTNVQVGSQISGIISALTVDFNSGVTNGQLIAQIDPAIYKAIVAQCAGDLANAQATVELAEISAKRSDELLKDHLIAESDHDTAVATLHQSQANVLMKRAALDKAQLDFDHTSIYAPVDGVVISRNVDVGQTVAASLSAPILYVIANDLTKMQIDALVSEADIGGVTTNQTVTFTVDAFPTRTFQGTVTQVRYAPMTNQNVVSYDTVVAVDNAEMKLKPGMTANVSIITAERNNALKIPNGALRFRPSDAPPPTNSPAVASGSPGQAKPGGGGATAGHHQKHAVTHTVYILAAPANGGKSPVAEPVQIKTGINDGISTEVTDGLKEGDLVIIGQNLGLGGAAQSGASNPFGGGGRRF